MHRTRWRPSSRPQPERAGRAAAEERAGPGAGPDRAAGPAAAASGSRRRRQGRPAAAAGGRHRCQPLPPLPPSQPRSSSTPAASSPGHRAPLPWPALSQAAPPPARPGVPVPCRRPRARSACPTCGAGVPQGLGESRLRLLRTDRLVMGPGRGRPAPLLGGPDGRLAPVPVSDLQPGDLLFYGPGGAAHVAMYVGPGTMVEAPYTGASVWTTGSASATTSWAPAGRSRPRLHHAGTQPAAYRQVQPGSAGPPDRHPGLTWPSRAMRPIPVDFHIGPLQVHTYGIGLAVTFWFGFVYFERRLRKNGYPTDWLTGVFLWIIVAAVVGARAHARAVEPQLLHAEPRRGLGHLARRALVVRRSAARRAGRHRPHPTPLPRAADRPRPRPRRARADGLLGHGPPARAPAHGGGRGPPDTPMVRHVLRRPARQAAARAGLPGAGGLRRLFDPHRHRAATGPLAGRDSPVRAIPRASSWARPWCSGASSAPSTSTCGSARTAASAPTSSSWPA